MSPTFEVDQELARLKTSVDEALKAATKLGVSAAEVAISKQTGISVSTRMAELETVEFNHDGALGITVYRGHKKGCSSTSDLSDEAIQQAVRAASEIARHTSEDDCNGLAPTELLVQDVPDLELYHPGNLEPEYAIDQALTTERHALDYNDQIVNSDGAAYSSHLGVRVYGNTNGLLVGYPSSRHSLSCAVIGQLGDDMERDYEYSVSRYPDRLWAPEEVGKRAAANTLARLGARKLDTCQVPVVICNELASGFIGHFVNAISGGSLYRKASFLLDHLGKPVFPDWLQINEYPHLRGELASSPFDHEGLATHDRSIVSDGALQTYLMTTYSARKLGMTPTGHAGGTHTWTVNHTVADQAELLKQMGTGLLVTELMGASVNGITGDYSRGAAGFWVENGVIQYPVHEVTIAGNLKEMYRNIVAIAGDQDLRKSTHCGSILLESMKVAGN